MIEPESSKNVMTASRKLLAHLLPSPRRLTGQLHDLIIIRLVSLLDEERNEVSSREQAASDIVAYPRIRETS
jgi:hypothetical protein